MVHVESEKCSVLLMRNASSVRETAFMLNLCIKLCTLARWRKQHKVTKGIVIRVTELPTSQVLDEAIVTPLVSVRWRSIKLMKLST